MAIVINTAPSDTASVNNEMLFVVYEATKVNDPVTYPDYRYVADVYVNDVFAAREIVRPDPLYKRGVFDVSKILQGYASYGFNASSNSVDYNPTVSYKLKFGEEYGDTLYTNLTVDSTARTAFESFKPKPFLSSSYTDFSSFGFISNMPNTVYVNRNQVWELLPYFTNTTGVINFLHNLKDESGNTIQVSVLDPSGIQVNRVRQFNVGTGAISNAAGAYATITVPVLNTLIMTIRYINDCRFTPHTLVWLNPYGAYESQSFGLVSKKNIELDRKNFSQLNYRLNASGEVSYQADNVFYGSKRGYATNVKTKLSMTSHLLTSGEYTWLADMFISPEVYIYDTTLAKFIPVTITGSNYDYNTYANARLTPLKFDVEYSDDYNSQNL